MNMRASSSSSSSSEIPRKTYDVFISFRGEDTRCNFISHLHSALRLKRIKTYSDEEDLCRGDAISPALLRAIEESQLSVIVFSKNYANSSWCLDELLHILWCKDNLQRHVIPVFYHVDPSDVRKQKRSYEEAFESLEQRFNEDKNKLQNWRIALNKASGFAGFSTQDIRFRSESILVEAIVEDIINKLNGSSSLFIGSENLVGIEKSVEQIEVLLQIGSSDIRTIGILGPGGIGKTTLARFIFWKWCSKFEGCCFLENIREESEKHRERHHLRNLLFSNLLGENDMSWINSFVIPAFIMVRLRRMKSLIVLDDVNDEEQLESLVESCEWFGSGSRIIVTTRDAQCLRNHFVDEIYKVKGLNSDEARQLFCWNALWRDSSMAPYPIELIESVVAYAEGTPLVLNVLRSLFEHNGRENWVTLLYKLKNSRAGEKIQRALMISYNDLNQQQRDVLLDIAFFFKGWKRHDVERVLEGQDFFKDSTIDDLVDKSLITINHRKEICMHDLVQEMGHQIVRKQSSKPGNRSRLCDAREIYHVLKSNKAREELRGIVLDISEIDDLNVSPDVFQRTYNLRFLKFINSRYYWKGKLHLPEGLQLLPDTLNYLHWDDYPSKSLPSKLAPEKLVEIIMSNSQVEQLWDGVQNLSNLRRIDLRHSKNLTEIPNLSKAPNLEEIDLGFCSSLFQVPSQNFQNLDKLRRLNMGYCEKLESLPHIIQSAEYLHLVGCINLKIMPQVKKENVFRLELRGSGIKELPASIGSFNNLTTMDLDGCRDLKSLPSSICRLKLGHLDLEGCFSLEEIPEFLPATLTRLIMNECGIEEVPSSSLELLSNLNYFSLYRCERLQTLPTTICKLKSLENLNLYGCSKFEDFPEILEPMEQWRSLDLSYTPIRTLPLSIKNLCGLQTLNLTSCTKLTFAVSKSRNVNDPDTTWLDCITSVISLHMSIQNHEEIPTSIASLSNLKHLYIRELKNLQSLPELPSDLEILDVESCMSLETVPSLRIAIIKCFLHKRWFRDLGFVSFFNCLKLDQNTLDNIVDDGQLRILLSATYALSTANNLGFYNARECCICYPGCEIPKWFIHRSSGSSITIKLPSNWLSDNFMGFSICLVVTFEDCNIYELDFSGDLCLMTGSGEPLHITNYSSRWWPPSSPESRFTSSDHVFMLYELTSALEVNNNAGVFSSITEVSFNFRVSLRPATSQGWCKVKRCGIRMLYLQEVEDLGVSIPPDFW